MPRSPAITASACSVVSTMTIVRSTSAATASAVPASSAPLARSGAVLVWSMSCTTSLKPAFTRLSAIGPPMAPSPMNPTLPAMLFSLVSWA
jgi:hypothetical protein